jgi:phosphoenolpyruvate synthase/pyruvate phosphate dikinase
VPKAILDDDSNDYAGENSKEIEALAADVNRAIREHDTPKLMKYFEDVLDNLHTSPSSSVFQDAETTHEREKLDRQEAEFKAALVVQCNQALRSHGINITRVIETGERDGYAIFARDKAGRRYETTIKYSDADEKIAIYGHDGFVRRLFDDVVREILAGRDRYFARMQ